MYSLEDFCLAKIVIFTLLKIIYPLLLPSHNCIIIHNVQFSRCMLSFQRNSMKFQHPLELQSVSLEKKWWARTRFSAEKPRRLQQSTGLLPRAAFRVHFGGFAFGSRLSRSWLLFKNFLKVVGQNGLEPSTSRLSVVCSSQLSYWPVLAFHFFWWRLAGSNRWPPACKAGALPAELNPQISVSILRYILSIPCKLNNALSTEHFVLTLGRYK